MNLSGIYRLAISCFGATLLLAGCQKPKTPPVAEFSFSPTSGAMDTVFTFDASGSSDAHDNIDCLVVRWDFEDDGTWDTDYSSEKTVSHRFAKYTDNRVVLEVKNRNGLTYSLKKTVSITDQGTITGMDPRMCVCCGGWWIRIQNDTLRFYDAPASTLDMLNSTTFPLQVRVKWTKKIPRCMGDEIIIYDLTREL